LKSTESETVVVAFEIYISRRNQSVVPTVQRSNSMSFPVRIWRNNKLQITTSMHLRKGIKRRENLRQEIQNIPPELQCLPKTPRECSSGPNTLFSVRIVSGIASGVTISVCASAKGSISSTVSGVLRADSGVGEDSI
jgi:hypothetical protein